MQISIENIPKAVEGLLSVCSRVSGLLILPISMFYRQSNLAIPQTLPPLSGGVDGVLHAQDFHA